MTMTADQRLIAYLDNELSAEERAQFEADMAKDEWLAAEVAKHRGLAARIAAARAPAIEDTPSRARTPAQSGGKAAVGRRYPAGQWVAMAVCLVLGVTIGVAYWPLQTMVQPAAAPVAATGPLAVDKAGVITAQGALDKALTTELAAEGGPIAVGLTFKGRNGRYCRTFQSIPDHLAGVACREADDHWVLQATTRFMPTAPTADYRIIGMDVPAIILDSVAALKAQDPLSALDERTARDKGWQPDQPPAPAAEPDAKDAPAAKAAPDGKPV